ncbi:hypothetical protein SOVF_186020 [Spinacia oleracea]|nr:hypothetical protein SOVF_186020 [Spinacia oleracea]
MDSRNTEAWTYGQYETAPHFPNKQFGSRIPSFCHDQLSLFCKQTSSSKQNSNKVSCKFALNPKQISFSLPTSSSWPSNFQLLNNDAKGVHHYLHEYIAILKVFKC